MISWNLLFGNHIICDLTQFIHKVKLMSEQNKPRNQNIYTDKRILDGRYDDVIIIPVTWMGIRF